MKNLEISSLFPHCFPRQKMSYSVKAKIRTDRIKKDGYAPIYLQVIINRVPKKISLDLEWPAIKFDEKSLCKKREKDDTDYNDYNIIIRDALGRVNEIFKYYRLTNQFLTLDLFEKEYNNPLSKYDFIEFMEGKIEERYKSNEIEKRTWLNHKNTLNKLKKFKKTIYFHSLNEKFALDFDRYLQSDCGLKTPNGRWGHHRDLKTYLGKAKKEKIMFSDPYVDFQNKSTPGKWKAIPLEELTKLYNYYKQMPLGIKRNVLQRFLFGCFTGLRLSDQCRIERKQIISNNLVFVPYKTRKKGKILIYPLTEKAIEVLNEVLKENEGDRIFCDVADQYANRVLKDIGKHLELESKLHHHAGRETFGTNFIAMGGSVTTLQKYFDHFNISTTMKYVHESQERIEEDIKKLNGMQLNELVK